MEPIFKSLITDKDWNLMNEDEKIQIRASE